MRLFNTMTRQVEEVRLGQPGVVRMYTCGPTVYRSVHIGNLRSYLMADWIRRAMTAEGSRVTHVKNITDVGHMRQELLDQGEDKVIQAALEAGQTPQEIAEFYTKGFMEDEAALNILPADHFPRATDHIPEMLEVTQRLMERGHAYEVQGNVYFSVGSFPAYGDLSGNIAEGLMLGVRAEVDPLKRDARDFALWKAAEPGRALKWPSPWGEGFPGWHIECSAMSVKYLGTQLDIHTGGVDNIFPHHEGELAQCEGAYGVPFVGHWVHGQHLLADGVKMSKSQANDYTLAELSAKGFEALAFRYLCLTVHYRTRMNFTFSALKAAQQGFIRLKDRVWRWSRSTPDTPETSLMEPWRRAFFGAVRDNLNLPRALSILWDMAHSDTPDQAKLALALEFDQVLGLGLERVPEQYRAPAGTFPLLEERSILRAGAQYSRADSIRRQLNEADLLVQDVEEETLVRPLSPWERRREPWRSYSSPVEAPSFLDEQSTHDFTVSLVVCNYKAEVQRCVASILPWLERTNAELVIVDNDSADGTQDWLEGLGQGGRVRVVHTDHVLGDGAAKNLALRLSLGEIVIVLDPSVEVSGDIFESVGQALEDPGVGVAGPWGLTTTDLHHFEEQSAGYVDAMQGYCMGFRRASLQDVGLFREGFRFYRNLDIDFSFQFKEKGYSILTLPDLPLVRHEHFVWSALSEQMRDELSHENFRRFTRKWGHRHDLLVHSTHEH